MEDVAFILSLVGLASVVLSYLMKGKNMILMVNLLFSVLHSTGMKERVVMFLKSLHVLCRRIAE